MAADRQEHVEPSPCPSGLTGLAAGERVGRDHRFSLRTAPFAEAEAWMRAIGATWDQRLEAFRRLVDGT